MGGWEPIWVVSVDGGKPGVESTVRVTGAVDRSKEEAGVFVATSGAAVQAVKRMIRSAGIKIRYEYFICSPYDAGGSHFGDPYFEGKIT